MLNVIQCGCLKAALLTSEQEAEWKKKLPHALLILVDGRR